jgi:hypothetical protein
MHSWLYRDTASLKADIQSGAMQAIYEKMFTEETKE